MTDGPNIIQDRCVKSENIPMDEDILIKEEPINESGITISSTLQEAKILTSSKNTVPVGNAVKSDSQAEKVILNVPEGHFVQFITPESAQTPCNMVVIKNSDTLYSTLPLNVKEKLKKNLNDKKNNKITQQKVPISKCPARKVTSSLTNKFSKFSKNALKLISKLENSETESCDLIALSTKRQKKKSDKFRSKESRSEFLARSR